MTTAVDPRLFGLVGGYALGFSADGQSITMRTSWPAIYESPEGKAVRIHGEETYQWTTRLPFPDRYPWYLLRKAP